MQETQETQVRFLGWKGPLEEEMATHSRILAQRTYGQKSLAGNSPQGHKELEMTDATEHMCVHNSINFSGMMGEEKGDQQTKYLGGEKGMGKRRRVYRGETKSEKHWGGKDNTQKLG